ncbi:MAG: Uncharacterised protein [Formosa sp. Hel3_A1_48]|nr:MAG: Uncharacterised protein [Formosa sp. Hel3_A1_48]
MPFGTLRIAKLVCKRKMRVIKTYYFGLLTIAALTILTGCHDYHNDMIDWADGIAIGTDRKSVKAKQPDFLTIDWNKPDTLDNGMLRFTIVAIKGHHDALKMEYFLEFDNNGYRGQFAHK